MGRSHAADQAVRGDVRSRGGHNVAADDLAGLEVPRAPGPRSEGIGPGCEILTVSLSTDPLEAASICGPRCAAEEHE